MPLEIGNHTQILLDIKTHLLSKFFSYEEKKYHGDLSQCLDKLSSQENMLLSFFYQPQNTYEQNDIIKQKIYQSMSGTMICQKSQVLPNENNLNWKRPVVIMRQINADFNDKAEITIPEDFSAYIEIN